MINFYCPGFFTGRDVYIGLIGLKAIHPELFNPGVEISKIFDSFPNMIWNGGGYNFNTIIQLDQIEEIAKIYSDLNVSL